MHKRLGFDAKLYSCKLFPFTFAVSESGTYVGVRFDCPGVGVSDSDSLPSQSGEIRKLAAQYPTESGGFDYPDPALFAPGEWLPMAQSDAIIEALISLVVRQDAPFDARLRAGVNLARQFLTRSREFSDEEFEEICAMLPDSLLVEVVKKAEPREPGRLDRIQMRRLLGILLYQPPPNHMDLPSGDRRRLRKALFTNRSAMALLGRPSRRRRAPEFPITEPPGTPTTEDWVRFRRAYFAAKLFGRNFFGPQHFHYPFLHGVYTLFMLYPCAVFLARSVAMRENRPPEARDFIGAIRRLDIAYGQAQSFRMAIERVQAGMFHSTGALERLLRWAGRNDIAPEGGTVAAIVKIPDELASVAWLEPWEPCPAGLEKELFIEVGPGHPLHDCRAASVARRRDCDDVLFVIEGGSHPFAVVHLTWTGKRERDPEWPGADLYSSLQDWIDRRMKPDHEDFLKACT